MCLGYECGIKGAGINQFLRKENEERSRVHLWRDCTGQCAIFKALHDAQQSLKIITS